MMKAVFWRMVAWLGMHQSELAGIGVEPEGDLLVSRLDMRNLVGMYEVIW